MKEKYNRFALLALVLGLGLSQFALAQSEDEDTIWFETVGGYCSHFEKSMTTCATDITNFASDHGYDYPSPQSGHVVSTEVVDITGAAETMARWMVCVGASPSGGGQGCGGPN